MGAIIGDEAETHRLRENSIIDDVLGIRRVGLSQNLTDMIGVIEQINRERATPATDFPITQKKAVHVDRRVAPIGFQSLPEIGAGGRGEWVGLGDSGHE